MKTRHTMLLVGLLVASVGAGCAATPAVQAPAANPGAAAGAAPPGVAAPPAQPTLGQFLGLRTLGRGLRGGVQRIRNRLGMRFPGLEARPPVLAITDPANLESPNPAVQAAAEVKAEEDQAPQKVKAIRYLASIGCSDCYPDIEPALLAALEDCTEAVRYAAVVGLRDAAGGPCEVCHVDSCCSPEVVRKLDEMGNELDEQGCYVEPSARVRRVARLAVRACGRPVAPADVPLETPPLEGPPGELPPPEPTPPAASPEVARAAFHSGPSSGRPAAQIAADGAPAVVRWEQITAPAGHFASPADARAVIAYWRRQGLGVAGPPPPRDFQAVQVRTHNWTTPHQAPSETLAQALFRLPVGSMSPILEDAAGFHVVRVLQRQPPGPRKQ